MIYYDNIMFKFKSNTIQILWPSESYRRTTLLCILSILISYQRSVMSPYTMAQDLRGWEPQTGAERPDPIPSPSFCWFKLHPIYLDKHPKHLVRVAGMTLNGYGLPGYIWLLTMSGSGNPRPSLWGIPTLKDVKGDADASGVSSCAGSRFSDSPK